MPGRGHATKPRPRVARCAGPLLPARRKLTVTLSGVSSEMATLSLNSAGSVLATSKPLRFADNAKVKCCGRCGNTYTTETNRQPVFKLCQDCKDVCQPWERRLYRGAPAKASK